MELLTLDENNQPSKMVEGYDSLIWTERYLGGDFQIITGDMSFISKYPEGTLLTLDESNQVMQVEDHIIARPKNQPSTLTMVGRSWDSILDRRVALSSVAGGTNEWSVVVKTPSDAAYFAIVKICVDGILDPADIFEPDKVQFPTPDDYLASTGPNRQYEIPKGNLLTAVGQLLQMEVKADPTTIPPTPAVVPHGIRAIRPDSAGTAVAIEIYVGEDKSGSVYFDATRDLLDDGKYVFTKRGSATTAYILGKDLSGKINRSSTTPTGLDRRVILVDGTNSGITDAAALQAQGEISLSEAKETAAFDGSINQDLNPYKYGVDYNLGDIVRMVGDYGLDYKARVTEYIRSKDKTGVKAYPTLTRVD